MKSKMTEFFERRFGKDHPHDSYYEEWVQRFATGHPERFMDSKSLEIYKQVLREPFGDD